MNQIRVQKKKPSRVSSRSLAHNYKICILIKKVNNNRGKIKKVFVPKAINAQLKNYIIKHQTVKKR